MKTKMSEGPSVASGKDDYRVGLISAEGVTVPRGGYVMDILNPATGQVIGTLFEAGAADVDAVVAGAKAAYEKVWRRTAPEDRARMLAAWADEITAHREELADLEVSDVGHLRREAMADIDNSARVLRYYAGIADKIEGRTFAQLPDRLSYGLDEPFGVVAGVSPYNGNANFVALKAGPALVAGNCIVIKAPEVAPLLNYRMVELALQAGLPAGVVNVVTGRGDRVGPLLTEHPDIGMIAFTGGPGSGRAIIHQSATNIVPTFLELGGKSPAILLPDANLDIAIPSLLHSNFAKSGQSCVTGSRIFVPASMYAEVSERLGQKAKTVRVGLPTKESSQMGTLINRQHRARVDALVKSAIDAGAVALAGGAPAEDGDLAEGAFYQPTVLADVTDNNPAALNEAFGPMASVLSYTDTDEVIARANASEFGLSAQIWGNDARIIQHLSKELIAGTVWINTYRSFHPTVPFGGMKQSGFGKENGFDSVAMYTRRKAVVWDLTTERQLPYTDI
ncbi:aldehyde dehydrogenase family protein [Pseudarthrobacter phenanthrenivorans]|uniref:Aldehyde dehydrogenase n=1 Tax=Pseudarthrobacter phenanthrenivorans TaxID=361575 RepID=A0A0B4D965_PSEPS|nr:aldehyde dehydrogenase family protein [Pseudarthrobacter phenanthrenivorans]KIC65287.1 aldehyde dehydrogenase [Pseudarthrobacter phenanthrenivorans]